MGDKSDNIDGLYKYGQVKVKSLLRTLKKTLTL